MGRDFKISRRRALAGLGAGVGASVAAPALLTQPSWAQSPFAAGKTIRMVVPFTPGGATDVIARIVADKLGQMWNTSIVIENKAGAGGNIGNEMVARAEPNGETMLMSTIGLALNAFLYKKLTYDAINDFTPVSLITMMPNMLIAPVNAPFHSVAELVAYGRANQGKLSYASSGIGTSIHLCGELFKKLTGIQMAHVPYRGSAPAVQDVMGGRCDLMFDNITSSLPQVQGKTLQGLAVTTVKRSSFVPDLPPVNETVPGFDVSAWFGTLVPAKTPPEIVARLSRDTQQALTDPHVKERLAALAAEPLGASGADFGKLIRSETDKWGKLIKEAGISAE
ncbi:MULTISPECIES: tripartite tricarboxylate transporter substrate binding protein [unclassified Beijerinckia]|uniref:tripartite tricarboxylate transporter substrate binding protein n=1 Tax=unclassified Beijerinckia TaxID=2638183 RepID=UPI00089D1760|nr:MULTISPECIES: tripartite tricarboxylate transporter substrate binding protein [unclassified Beijerinckia]MDH7796669.1 tripartite-type tricarboxylate transporter receptor subunit TctC [Beijerinckia sp. GAS462]SEC54951.1 Tat (twin-arginine translocation) pathway signal sequence [Beijerinckia sp. 28-YEA-48]